MATKFETTISRACETVSETLKNAVRAEFTKYSPEYINIVGFGDVATSIFKSLDSAQRGEIINSATDNKLMTGETTNKRVFYLIKKICGR